MDAQDFQSVAAHSVAALMITSSCEAARRTIPLEADGNTAMATMTMRPECKSPLKAAALHLR
jgi:hypothetical protein